MALKTVAFVSVLATAIPMALMSTLVLALIVRRAPVRRASTSR